MEAAPEGAPQASHAVSLRPRSEGAKAAEAELEGRQEDSAGEESDWEDVA